MSADLCLRCQRWHGAPVSCEQAECDDNAKRRKEYGRTRAGAEIAMPAGWRLLPFGEVVPSVHRECHQSHTSPAPTWCAPRRQRSTMTPMRATAIGWLRAIGVPDEH